MKNLKLVTLDAIDHIVTPNDFKKISLDSPATEVFTDFKLFKPLMIEANTKAVDALKLMLKAHVQLKVVMAEPNDFVGIISSYDVSEQNIMHHVALGYDREDLLVSDLMLPRRELKAFDVAELERSTVHEVIESLKLNGLRYCLVKSSDSRSYIIK